MPVRLVRHDPAEPAELLALVLRFAGLQPALGYASACAVVMRRRMSADAPGGGGEQSGATPVRVPSGAHAIDSSVSDADRSTYQCIERACRWCLAAVAAAAAAAAAAAKLRSFPLRSFPLRSFPLLSFPLRAAAAAAAGLNRTQRRMIPVVHIRNGPSEPGYPHTVARSTQPVSLRECVRNGDKAQILNQRRSARRGHVVQLKVQERAAVRRTRGAQAEARAQLVHLPHA